MGIEQVVGTLPKDWKYTTLGDACSPDEGGVQTGPFGSQLHAADYVAEGIPSIMPQNIGDNRVIPDGIAQISAKDAERLHRYRVRTGDIVYSRRGDVEKRALIRGTEDGWLCGTGCLRVRFGWNQVDSAYASYYLGAPNVREWIVRHAHGATMPNLNTAILSALPFVLPPLPQQRAIAHILGTLDDKIELNRQMSETLDAMARALFQSWFVDFDPVRARVEGRPAPLAAQLADLFPGSFESPELGDIPTGWVAGTLASVANLNQEAWSRETRPATIRYVDLSNTKWGRIEAVTTYSREDAPSRAQRVLRPGDSIVGTVRPGNGSYAFVSDEGLTGSTGFAVLRPKQPSYAEFVYLAATDRDNIDALAHLADGGAYPAVRPEVVVAASIAKPPDQVLAAFSGLTKPWIEKSAANDREANTLAALRDTLLPKLISGELRVKDAERFVARTL